MYHGAKSCCVTWQYEFHSTCLPSRRVSFPIHVQFQFLSFPIHAHFISFLSAQMEGQKI